MQIEKKDVIIFMSKHYADAYELKDSFFEKSEEEQLEFIEKYAREYHLPMSMGKVISVFVAKQLLSVADKEKIKDDIKKIQKERVRKRYEKKIEAIDKMSL